MKNPLIGQSTERVHDELEVAFHRERGCAGTVAQAVYSRTSVRVAPWPWRTSMITCVLVGERGLLSESGCSSRKYRASMHQIRYH
jgi:hypothetical protein